MNIREVVRGADREHAGAAEQLVEVHAPAAAAADVIGQPPQLHAVPGGDVDEETTPGIFAQNTFEFRDTLSRVIGNHGMKFGIEIRKGAGQQ